MISISSKSTALLLLLQIVTLAFANPITTCSSSSGNFVLQHHLGNLSPYFDAPVPSHLSLGVPSSCHVLSVLLVHCHGSCGPILSKLGFICNLSYYLNNQSMLLSNPKAPIPDQFSFLAANGGWNSSNLKQEELTAVGWREAFDHGVAVRLAYLHHNTTKFFAGKYDCIVETAQCESVGVKSYITPFQTCKNWNYTSSGGVPITQWSTVYLPPIAAEFNQELQNV
ncbi:related to Thiamine-repressible acid phosphatase precursor [Melanopsichium pennsylvanicum]|uniref:Related to Thiamine-repressible acid phosphatase n=1 Tax=Melanopsichium pennsylvanicum TaxID=63383 RepID=A0AAJ4XSJ6_9BASI|nr:related to Thiamine-repressible acid phosphatase precursor [Melanopsichium pennsylvanicum]